MPDSREPKFFYGYVVVAITFFIMVVMWGTFYSFGVFFKPLLEEFGWTRAVISGAFSLGIILQGLLGIVMGRLNDRFGPRSVLTGCSFFLGLGYLLMSQVSTTWQLYLFYGVIVAIGMSAGYIPLVSTVARWFVKGRGMMTGIILAGIGLGTMIIPPLASRLILTYDWRTSYIIVGITVLVLVILAAQFLRRDPSQKGQLPYSVGEVNEQKSNLDASGFSLRQAIRTRQFWMLWVMQFSYGFGLMSIMVHIVVHATGLGISLITAANIVAIIGGIGIAGRVIMGSAADRIGNKSAIIIGFILMSAVLFWLVVAREVWMLYLFAIILGFAYGGLDTPFSPMIAELFGLSSHGALFGIIALGFAIGGAIGPVLAGAIFDITRSYGPAFLVSAVVSVIGLILTVLLKPIIGGEKNDSGRSP